MYVITRMNTRRLDFNLLAIFEAVMIEGSVTRAASRLGMTQPAVSNALVRLRHLFNDDLFVKMVGGVAPTARARVIWEELRQPLRAIHDLTTPTSFQPEESQSVFRLAITDSLVARLVPAVIERFRNEAPQAKIYFLPHTNPSSTLAIERGELDCAVGMFPNPPSTLQVEGLFTDTYVCVASRKEGNFATEHFTLQRFVNARHVLVKQAIGDIGIVDNWLSLQGVRREIAIIVNACADALAVVAGTTLLTSVPSGFVAASPMRPDVVTLPLPFDTQKILYKLAWSASGGRGRRDRWFQALVANVARSFAAS